MSSNTTVARHRGGSRAVRTDGVKANSTNRETERSGVSLLEVWLATRGIALGTIAESADVDRKSIYNLIDYPERARASTLDATSSATSGASGGLVRPGQVAALAARRVVDPNRVSDEIAEALAGAAQKAG